MAFANNRAHSLTYVHVRISQKKLKDCNYMGYKCRNTHDMLQHTVAPLYSFENFSSGYRNWWEDSAEINASDWQYLLCNKTFDLTIRLNGIITVVVSLKFRKCWNVYVQCNKTNLCVFIYNDQDANK